jgi:hypothetical protein
VFTQDYARPRASKLVGRRRDDGSRRSRAARQMVLLVGAGVVAAVGAQSAAAADWSIQPVPLPLRPASTELSGVSCLSTSDCIAVGVAYVNATGDSIPLVEHWNGTSWSIERAPTPPLNAGGGALWGVSCTSSSACVAVGSFGPGGGPLFERWEGRGWSVQDDYGSDNHSDYYVEVFGSRRPGRWSLRPHPNIACSNSNDEGGEDGLAAVSCGSSSGATDARLTSLSSVSPASCVAVGTYANRASRSFTPAESLASTPHRSDEHGDTNCHQSGAGRSDRSLRHY